LRREENAEQAVPLEAEHLARRRRRLQRDWAHRIAVEKRRCIGDGEFADIVGLCQFMPGPNIVGVAVCVGAKMRWGPSLRYAAPCTVGLSLGALDHVIGTDLAWRQFEAVGKKRVHFVAGSAVFVAR
jgi:chromate transporter